MQISADLLDYFSTDFIFAYILIATRIGGAIAFLPGFGEGYITLQAKVALVLAITMVMAPVLESKIPAMPPATIQAALLLGAEFMIGAFLGLLARLIYIALEVGGMIIAFQLSLGNATVFNPAMATQGSVVSVFLVITGGVLLFATNMHHLMLLTVLDSYTLFEPGISFPTGDMADFFARTLSNSFVLAVQMASPFLVIGLVFYAAMGLLGRLMPQIQVFFLAIPLQSMLGFFVLFLIITALFTWFLTSFENTLEGLLDVNSF